MKIVFSALLAMLAVLPGGISAEVGRPLFPTQPLVMQSFQGTLWVQTSAEHAALCRQAYAAATSHLDAALADPQWSAALEQGQNRALLPPAIIVDVDETILDNSPFQGELLRNGTAFDPALFTEWVETAQAKPLPGAVAFLRAAHDRGVTIFYVTNRKAHEEPATRDNLARAGFPLDDHVDTVLMRLERPNWIWDKSSRREAIVRGYRVLMLIGDDLNDFVGNSRVTLEQRHQLSDSHRDWWGERWIILPNPTYGSWLGAIYDYEWGITEQEQRRLREHVLDVFRP